MKLILYFVFLCVINISSSANHTDTLNAYYEDKVILSLGYGSQSMDQTFYAQRMESHAGELIKKGWGPFHFRGEYGLSNKIGIGISINYCNYGGTLQSGNYGTGSSYTNSISVLTSLLRFNYHFATTKQLDPFFAIGAGFISAKNKFTANNSSGSNSSYNYTDEADDGTIGIPIAFEAVAGLRYYLDPNISIYSEMGVAKSIIQFGLSVSF